MKKITIGLIILLIIVAGGFIYYKYFYNKIDSSLVIENEDIKKKDFLKDKQAVIYFSSTIDQDVDNKGLSYAVFINDKGEATGHKMKSLELGTIVNHDDELLLVDKNKIRLIGNTYKEFKMNKEQHTGDKSGYLEKQKIYFTLFNSGRNKNGNYDSNVYYGNDKGFKMGNVPYYILTSGVDYDEVPILTQDPVKNKYVLRKLLMSPNKFELKDIVMIDNKNGLEYDGLSPIISDKSYYYLILSEYIDDTNDNTVLFRINKKTLKQDKFDLIEYKNNDNITATFPFNTRNSSYIYENKLYYIDGLGQVITFDTKSNKIEKKFTIDNPVTDGVRHGEEIFFKNDKLYLTRYDEKRKDKYYIEIYSLVNGKKLKEINIKGLDKIISSVKGKSIHSYDFKMLK